MKLDDCAHLSEPQKRLVAKLLTAVPRERQARFEEGVRSLRGQELYRFIHVYKAFLPSERPRLRRITDG